MDLYAKNEKALRQLRDELISDIRTVLKEKGYTSGSVRAYWGVTPGCEFYIESDRLIIDNVNAEHILVDDLVKHLRNACHVLPKNE